MCLDGLVIFTYVVTFIGVLYFELLPVSCHFTQRTPFVLGQVCWQQTLSDGLSWSAFLSPSFWKESFARYRILGWQYFSFLPPWFPDRYALLVI